MHTKRIVRTYRNDQVSDACTATHSQTNARADSCRISSAGVEESYYTIAHYSLYFSETQNEELK